MTLALQAEALALLIDLVILPGEGTFKEIACVELHAVI